MCASCNTGGSRETVELQRVESGLDGLEYVKEFCYLGDVLSAGDDAESSSVCRVRGALKKFRELILMLS